MFFYLLRDTLRYFICLSGKKNQEFKEFKSDYNVKEHCIIRGHLSAIIKRYGCSWVSLGFMCFIKTQSSVLIYMYRNMTVPISFKANIFLNFSFAKKIAQLRFSGRFKGQFVDHLTSLKKSQCKMYRISINFEKV